MLKLKVEINGKSINDLVIALEEVMNKVEDEYTSGFDRNDSGNYSFEVNGEEEIQEDED